MEKIPKPASDEQKQHCLILPFPFQGHINPLVQFAKRLVHKSVSITLAIPVRCLINSSPDHFPFPVHSISDGFDDGLPTNIKTPQYVSTFRQAGRESLAALLDRIKESSQAVDCIVYGAFMPWVMEVAKEWGTVGAPFLTQSCGVNNIYYSVWKGELKAPVVEGEVRGCGLPEMDVSDLPSFVRDPESQPGAFELVLSQFDGAEDAVYVLLNSVYELEEEAVNWLSKFLPVKTIGPTVPSAYLDNRIPQDKGYGLNLFEPDTSCIKWLDTHPPRSVIYVSFGSLIMLETIQMSGLWEALILSKKPFLWVVRSSEESKLPTDAKTCNGMEGRGLIVSWCPQLEVLAHDSIGCFVTHCGWNSTLESLSLGVPTVGIPGWSDQSTNMKFLMDVWGVGVRATADGQGVVKKEEIMRCLEHVMEGERGEDVRKNASKWKELMKRAVDKGGSSDVNIEEFLSKLKSLTQK